MRGDAWGASTFTCANLGDAPARIRLPAGAWKLALPTEPSIGAVDAGGTLVLAPSTAAIYERTPPTASR